MGSDNGKIYIATAIDNDELRRGATEASNILHGIGDSAAKEGASIDAAMKKIAASATAIFAVSKLKEYAQQVANVRGEFQQLEMAFKTMLGSSEKADALMSQLINTAATTPFGMTDVAQGAKQLLAYGVAADEVNETLIRLGDIAAGLSIPLNDLAYLYGTTMVQGRMYTQDLNQFLGRGIPLTDELAKQFGVAKEEVKKLVEEGKVGFPEVKKAIESLTDEGGKFGGLMEAQSQTITGQISNIEDSIEQMFNEIGKSSEGVIGKVLDAVSTAVDHWKEIGGVILSVAAAYGTYKAALIALTVIQKIHNTLTAEAALQQRLAAMSGIALSEAQAMAAARTTLLTSAWNGLKAAIMSNPIGLILGVLAGAATALGLFSDNTGKAAEMTQKYGEKAVTAITRVNSLSTALNGLTAGSAIHKKTMEELNGILEEYGIAAVKEGDGIDVVNKKRTQAIELIKQEAIERQRLNDIASGDDSYAKALADAQKGLREGLDNARTTYNKSGYLALASQEIRENAAAISTIIAQQVEQDINLIAGKTGEEYEKGLDKIYANINDKMRAIGISDSTISQYWFKSDFWRGNVSFLREYIDAVQAATEEHDRYTTAVNNAADAEQAAADKSMTYSEKQEALSRKLQGASGDVHQLYENIKNLMSQYSDNTIGFHIRFDGEIPKWMMNMGIDELKRLGAWFSSHGAALPDGGSFVTTGGVVYTKQQALQRGADYARAADAKQTQQDEAERKAKEAADRKKSSSRGSGRTAADKQREKEQLAEAAADRAAQIADYTDTVIEQEKQSELAIRQAEIELMDEGFKKQSAQLELNYKKLMAENESRERQMLEALADKKLLEWENQHPKAKNSEKRAYRDSLLDPESENALTRADLMDEQVKHLEDYEKLAEETKVRGNKEMLRTMLQDALTYEQQREKTAEEYQKKIESLYQHDENGNRLKDAGGNDRFIDGASQKNVDELLYQSEEAIKGIDEQFAQREDDYLAWCNAISSWSIEQLETVLQEAKQKLEAVKDDKNASPQQLAVARAKVNKAQDELNKAKAQDKLNPGQKSIKEWEDLYRTLNEVEKEFEGIGNTIGGVIGDIISECGKAAVSTLQIIDGIKTFTNGAQKSIEATSKVATQSLKTVEKASVILTIISAALQIATQIANLFNDDDQKQKEIDRLQDRIDQLQWEIDNADTVRLKVDTDTTGLDLVRDALADARRELFLTGVELGDMSRVLTAAFSKASADMSLMQKAASEIAREVASASYTDGKWYGRGGGSKYDESKEMLENYAQQMLLIDEQIEQEKSKKKSDDSAIKEMEQKLDEIYAKMNDLINSMVEDIIGGSAEDIADQLSDAFFEAFRNGEDAAKAWGDKVNDIVADIVRRMLVQKFLTDRIGKVIDKYKDRWFDDDGNFMGIDEVLASMDDMTSDLTQVGEEWQQIYDALPDNIKEKIDNIIGREGAAKGIAQASQDSVDELNGRMTAVQGHTFSISENTKLLLATTNEILRSVMNIEGETAGFGARLERMETSAAAMRDTLDDIATRGVRLKN